MYYSVKRSLQKGRIFFLFILTQVLCWSCATPPKNDYTSTNHLRLITYNVWYGFTKLPERRETWITWMKQQKPDIVSLQELNEYTADRLAKDAARYGHNYSILLKEEGFPTGLTSKYPIEDTVRLLEGFHHGLIRAKIRDIFIYVVHLHPSNWEFRTREIRLIIDDMRKLPPGSDVILAGDFNTFSPADSIFYIHGKLEPFFEERDSIYAERNLHHGKLDYSVIQQVHDFGMRDLEAALRTSNYNFSGSFPTLILKEWDDGDNRRLDYVFATPGLANRAKRAEIIRNDTTLLLSDHLPVLVDFSVEY